jgi:PadR family transcriptional regulator, regulatory protein PadR
MYSKELLKGTLSTILLTLLDEKGRMYGYEITQAVKERTDGKILLKEGSLYPALHKLEAEGFLSTEEEFIGKRPRIYYRLTTTGKAQSRILVDELFQFYETLQQLIVPQPELNYGAAG